MISKPITRRVPLLLAAISLACAAARAQGQRPVAIVNANILTMEGKPIEMGMVLFRNGKIVDVGKKVKLPAGARIVDAKGGTVMPGLVSAYSRAGLSGSTRTQQVQQSFHGPFRPPRRSRSSGGSNRAATKVVSGLYARQKVFRELLEQGVTTLALSPSGMGFPGQGAILDPAGKTLDDLTVDDAAFLMVSPARNTKAKKLLKDTLEKAKKVLEERKKPAPKPAAKPASKPAGKTPASKPTSQPTPKPKPGEKKEEKKKESGKTPPQEKATTQKTAAKKPAPKKKDPNLEVLADLLDKKHRAFITLNSAADLVHYLDAVGDTRFKTTILANDFTSYASVTSGLLDQAIEKLKQLEAPVLMDTGLATKPWTDHLVNLAANLHRAGIQVGFVLGENKGTVRGLFPRLINLLHHGLDRDVALKGVTLVPATMLGVEDRVGSIKKDKDADLLLFSGDPLDPTSQLLTVWHKGTEVKKETEEQ